MLFATDLRLSTKSGFLRIALAKDTIFRFPNASVTVRWRLPGARRISSSMVTSIFAISNIACDAEEIGSRSLFNYYSLFFTSLIA